jgi:hypothetical protein
MLTAIRKKGDKTAVIKKIDLFFMLSQPLRKKVSIYW